MTAKILRDLRSLTAPLLREGLVGLLRNLPMEHAVETAGVLQSRLDILRGDSLSMDRFAQGKQKFLDFLRRRPDWIHISRIREALRQALSGAASPDQNKLF